MKREHLYCESVISDKVLLIFNILFALVGFVFVFINIASNEMFMTFANGSIAIICLTAFLLVKLKKTQAAIILDVVTFSIIFTSYIFNGGAAGFSLIWLVLLPAMIMYVLTFKYGTILCGIIQLILILFFWTPLKVYCYPFSDTYFVRFPIVYAAAVAIAVLSKLTVVRAERSRDELLEENISYKEHLQQLVEEQAKKIKQQSKEISEMQQSIILGIANIVESRDGSTGMHIKRSAEFVDMLAGELLLREKYPDIITEKYVTILHTVAPMHDIGKVQVPDAILRKSGKLTEEEYEIIKSHSAEGGRLILKTMGKLKNQKMVKIAYEVAAYHHERWDGTGYPNGLAGEEIPLSARIMAVADVFEALTAQRAYKEAFDLKKSFAIIEQYAGTLLDPELVQIFLEMREKIAERLESLNREGETAKTEIL